MKIIAKETLEQAIRDRLPGLRIVPALSESELRDLESRWGVRLSSDNRDLLRYASGFTYEPFGEVRFLGNPDYAFRRLFPRGLATAGDGDGDFWLIDVREDSGEWGPVFFLCHDPPITVVQAADLGEFIGQILAYRTSEGEPLRDLAERACFRIWHHQPDLIDADSARHSADPSLLEFAAELPANYRIVDLRVLERGKGFSWGTNGPQTDVRRFGSELLFAVEPRRRSWIDRILSRKRGQ